MLAKYGPDMVTAFGQVAQAISVLTKFFQDWGPWIGKAMFALSGTTQAAIVVSSTLNDIMGPAIRGMIGQFLNFVEVFVDGAASAFGWIPGIGPKLRTAASEFDAFKQRTNQALNGIQSHKVVSIDVMVNGQAGTVKDIGGGVYNIQVGGKTVRALAQGGIVMPRPGGTIIQTAEAGEPEVVLPLSKASQFGFGGAPQGGQPLVVNIYPQALLGTVEDLRQWARRGVQEAIARGLVPASQAS
jgi:hypothetical protein